MCVHARVTTAMKLISEHRTYNIKTFNEIRESHVNQNQVHRVLRIFPPVRLGPALIADLLRVYSDCSEVITIVTLGEFRVGGICELFVHILNVLLIKNDLRGLKNWSLNKGQIVITIKMLLKARAYPTSLRRSQMKGFSNW